MSALLCLSEELRIGLVLTNVVPDAFNTKYAGHLIRKHDDENIMSGLSLDSDKVMNERPRARSVRRGLFSQPLGFVECLFREPTVEPYQFFPRGVSKFQSVAHAEPPRSVWYGRQPRHGAHAQGRPGKLRAWPGYAREHLSAHQAWGCARGGVAR